MSTYEEEWRFKNEKVMNEYGPPNKPKNNMDDIADEVLNKKYESGDNATDAELRAKDGQLF